MGAKQINYAKNLIEENLAYHSIKDVEEEALVILEQAKKLAFNTLKKERELLLVLASILNTKTRIEKNELQQLVKQHGRTKIIDSSYSTFYRDKLTRQVKNLSLTTVISKVSHIQLNKNID